MTGMADNETARRCPGFILLRVRVSDQVRRRHGRRKRKRWDVLLGAWFLHGRVSSVRLRSMNSLNTVSFLSYTIRRSEQGRRWKMGH